MRSPICESKDSELGRALLGHWGQMRQSERSLGASAASALGLLRTTTIAAILCHRWQLAAGERGRLHATDGDAHLHQVRAHHPRQYGLALRRAHEPLALGPAAG